MTWKEQIVSKILLLVARMFAEDPTIREEIKHLSNHISIRAPHVSSDS